VSECVSEGVCACVPQNSFDQLRDVRAGAVVSADRARDRRVATCHAVLRHFCVATWPAALQDRRRVAIYRAARSTDRVSIVQRRSAVEAAPLRSGETAHRMRLSVTAAGDAGAGALPSARVCGCVCVCVCV
jgi:hypothetical protein